jgi:hypothetical protein
VLLVFAVAASSYVLKEVKWQFYSKAFDEIIILSSAGAVAKPHTSSSSRAAS